MSHKCHQCHHNNQYWSKVRLFFYAARDFLNVCQKPHKNDFYSIIFFYSSELRRACVCMYEWVWYCCCCKLANRSSIWCPLLIYRKKTIYIDSKDGTTMLYHCYVVWSQLTSKWRLGQFVKRVSLWRNINGIWWFEIKNTVISHFFSPFRPH